MARKAKHQFKSTEKREAESKASRKLAELPTTFPISDLVATEVAHHDRVAHDCEVRWGVGRLPELVEPDLAKKFYAQQKRMFEAMRLGTIEQQTKAVAAMSRAWTALDKRASELGCSHVPEKWFEVETSRGLVAVCVSVEATEVAMRTGRYKLAVHAQALSAIIEDNPKLFDFLANAPPGRVSIRRRSTTGSNSSPFNDELPF